MTAATPPPELVPLNLSYRPDLGILTVRWLRDVSFEELQAGFRAASHLSRTHHVTHWLVDVRRRTLLDAFQSEWVAQRLLPEAAATLMPRALCVAYLLSPARFESLRVLPSLAGSEMTAQAPSQSYALRTFTQEDLAMRWLLAQSGS